MQLLITLKSSGRPSDLLDAVALRRDFEQFLQLGLSTRRLIASGTFADAPGGFVIVDVDSVETIDKLLSVGMMDHFCVLVNHLAPVEMLVENLQAWDDTQMYI